MKADPTVLSRSYSAALCKYLRSSAGEGVAAARVQGLRAVKLGLDTLDLAKIHEEALHGSGVPRNRTPPGKEDIRRAGAFFVEAITPIEETHRGAREANVRSEAMIAKLKERSDELATSNLKLKREILQRKAVEDSLRISEKISSALVVKALHMQDKLKQLSRRLLSVQEEERKTISRELHEVIGQTLTGINLRLATLKTLTAGNGKDIHKKIVVTQRLVEKSVSQVHRFASDLRPTVLDYMGLIPALHAHVLKFMEQTGIRVDLTAFAGVEKLDNDVKTALYRVAQESLNNILSHAEASRAVLEIVHLRNFMRMEISDDGKGFSPDEMMASSSTERLGLLGMRERVEMVGGTFCVESSPGGRTTVRVEIPSGPSRKRQIRKSNPDSLKCP